MGRNVSEHNGVRADHGVMADGDTTEDSDAATNVDAIFDYRYLTCSVSVSQAKGRVVANVAVVTDGFGVQDHATVVPDSNTPAHPYRIG
jgi:hypothetical protein